MDIILQYIDAIWLLVAWLVVKKEERFYALGFVAGGMVLMRLQVDLMQSIGYETGILHFTDMPAFHRGIIIYSLFYVVYLSIMALAKKSPEGEESEQVFAMAASIGLFFTLLFVSTMAMIV